MQWEGKADGSGRVEDRRGIKPGVAVGGGVGTLIVLALVYFGGLSKEQAQQLVGKFEQRVETKKTDGNSAGLDDKTKEFTGTVIALTDEVWEDQFRRMGRRYEKPGMVLFAERVNTNGCGTAPSAVGPFYCPADKKVYLDPTFFNTLEQQLGGSKAEFSQAYVIAHEVGHHVQNLLGYNRRLQEIEEAVPAREKENQGIRLELQADYLAGVWAHHADKTKKILERGDVEEAIKTAKNIGDDAIQKKTQGWTSPEKYNHGTAAQRYKYFMRGFESGDAGKEALDKFFDPRVKPLEL